MTSSLDWPRLRTLFEHASALAPPDREALLARLRAEDPSVCAMVEKLLAAEARDDDFLQPPFPAEQAPSLAGRRVGGFRVVRAVASGGMGTVWEAEQDEPRRKVAVKTMHSGLASAQFRRRFRFESELLAGLRHPAIAQVYGAGVLEAEDGGPSLPWFALEFVEGARPLFRYAQEERLDLAARLRLFQSVCSAVQHAHQRGVIHRDLKAANLLVDRDGHVKVIDFGIARLIDGGEGGNGDEARHTLAGEVVGTLEAMSPEQVEGQRGEVDARTDVYALGAALYELTTDRRPYDLDGLALPEAARRIREVDPVAPSRVDSRLPREIDWIVGKAMEKEPARRYPSASEIENEIERLLAREPVLAGPPSRTYRLRKFCQRHRVGVAAGLVGLLAVFVGLAGLAFGFVKQQDARFAEAAAQTEANLAKRFSGILVGLFQGLMPDALDGKAFTRTALLERGEALVHSELSDQPLLQARLLHSIGHVHSGFGQWDKARAALEEAVRLARAQGRDGERDLVEALVRLGHACRRLEDVGAAEAALREALALEERLVGKNRVKLGPILNELGVLLAVSRPEEALGFYQRAYDLEVARRGADHGDAALLLANMGTIDLRAHRYEAARARLARALPVLAEHHGANDPRTARVTGRLATVYRCLGNYRQALALQERDLDVTTRALGADHQDVGASLVSLAQITEALGDVPLALEQAGRATAILARRLEPAHPTRMIAESTRAHLLIQARRFDAARSALADLAALAPKSDAGKLAWLSGTLVRAELEHVEGNHAASLQLADRVLADPASRWDVKLVADAHWARAYALARQGEHAEAMAARERARAALPPVAQPASVAHAHAQAQFAAASGDPAGAVAVLAEAVAAGFQNAAVLTDPQLDGVRAQPGFAAIAAALQQNQDK